MVRGRGCGCSGPVTGPWTEVPASFALQVMTLAAASDLYPVAQWTRCCRNSYYRRSAIMRWRLAPEFRRQAMGLRLRAISKGPPYPKLRIVRIVHSNWRISLRPRQRKHMFDDHDAVFRFALLQDRCLVCYSSGFDCVYPGYCVRNLSRFWTPFRSYFPHEGDMFGYIHLCYW